MENFERKINSIEKQKALELEIEREKAYKKVLTAQQHAKLTAADEEFKRQLFLHQSYEEIESKKGSSNSSVTTEINKKSSRIINKPSRNNIPQIYHKVHIQQWITVGHHTLTIDFLSSHLIMPTTMEAELQNQLISSSTS